MQQSLNPQPIPPGKVQIESVTTKPAMLPASGPSPQIDPPHSNLMRSSRGENDTSIKSMSSEKKDDRKRAAVGTSPQIDPPHSNLGRNTKSLENSQKLRLDDIHLAQILTGSRVAAISIVSILALKGLVETKKKNCKQIFQA